VHGTRYYKDSFVYVKNDTTLSGHGDTDPSNLWVAYILEIRAKDEHHVYARIYWMYSPDELPKGTFDGKNLVQGRQPYHGQNELIASNHSKYSCLHKAAL
jgi:hypothetical protein